MLAKPLIIALLSIPASAIIAASAEMRPNLDEQALKLRYDAFVESLDVRRIAMVKRAVERCDDPEKDAVLQEMAELDDWAQCKALADLEQLARRAARGDQVAILQLRQRPHGLVDLIAEGRLVVAESPAKAGAARLRSITAP